MKLTVVGMSGSYPGPRSPASCYLVEQEYAEGTFRLLLDLGNGALGPLQDHLDLAAIDAVLLSHLHADHCIDMCGLYVERKYYTSGPTPRVPVFGPAGTSERLARAYDLSADPGMTNEFDFHTYPEGPFPLGPFRVTARRVVHPVPAYAVRLEADGRALTYSGDSGACDALVEIARGADLLLCEASFVEGASNPSGLHLTGREAAEHATRAEVGRLVLTHIPPVVDAEQVLGDAKPAYAGPVEVAACGATYTV